MSQIPFKQQSKDVGSHIPAKGFKSLFGPQEFKAKTIGGSGLEYTWVPQFMNKARQGRNLSMYWFCPESESQVKNKVSINFSESFASGN